jgi:hypothetical protein
VRATHLRVVAYRVGRPPEVVDLRNTLEAFQAFVGGSIEAYPVNAELCLERRLLFVWNEDGIRLKLPMNRGSILGDFFVCAKGVEDWDSLTAEEAAHVARRLP